MSKRKIWYEVDLRSRITGLTEVTIYSGHDYDEAYNVLRGWYEEHPELDMEIDREEYVDGSDGVFADLYADCEHHGVGVW